MDNKIQSTEFIPNSATIAITGAAGNLGSLLVKSLMNRNYNLHLMIHKKDMTEEIKACPSIKIFRCDLAIRDSLHNPLNGCDVLVHFAGVLFKGNPEKFLPITNTVYFRNLLDTAITQNIKRIILISFPHVEGETSPANPATGHLNGNPESMHAKTRLEEEKLLFEYKERCGFEAISLRIGMVYGKGILMIDAAQWFARHRLLGVWKKPTYIHLISKDDFLDSTIAAIEKANIGGIYHIGDEGIQTLQEFLDFITIYKGNRKP